MTTDEIEQWIQVFGECPRCSQVGEDFIKSWKSLLDEVNQHPMPAVQIAVFKSPSLTNEI